MCATRSLTNLGGEHRAKPVPPEPDGLVADVDPALGQQILDVAQRQRVSHVHHHDQTDDLWRAVEISERIAHAPKPNTAGTAREFALTKSMQAVGQAPIVVNREIEGFILNRLQGALLKEAWALFEEGYASAADIDLTVSQGLGLRWTFMGPFETIDLERAGRRRRLCAPAGTALPVHRPIAVQSAPVVAGTDRARQIRAAGGACAGQTSATVGVAR